MASASASANTGWSSTTITLLGPPAITAHHTFVHVCAPLYPSPCTICDHNGVANDMSVKPTCPEKPYTAMAVEGIAMPHPNPEDEGADGPVRARAYDVVLVAASAGGLAAISAVLGALPADFPVPVLVVQHLDPRHGSLMSEILAGGRRCRRGGRRGGQGRGGHRLPRTARRASARHRRRPPAPLARRPGALRAALGRPAVRVRCAGVPRPCHRRRPLRNGQRRQHGRARIAGGRAAPSSPRIPPRPSSPACRRPPSPPGACDFVLPLEEIGPALVDLVGARMLR